MRRRQFISLIGGAATLWPFAARAQQAERVRRIGVLINRAVEDPEGQARLAGFLQGLHELGWAEGRNVRIDTCWGGDEAEQERKCAADLVALAPDIFLAAGTLSVVSLQQLSRNLPIVFAGVTDPVGAGFVDSLAHPGGNATGFMIYEYSLAGKWLELLRQIAPGVTRVGVIRNPTNPAGLALFSAAQTAAQSLGMEAFAINARDSGEIERAVAAFARSPNGGLIVAPDSTAAYGSAILSIVAQYKLPAVYGSRYIVSRGGLISYAPNAVVQFRLAAAYVDRILKGEKPGDLPVQVPTNLELVINLKTAKAMGIAIPPAILARADEVIE